MPDLGGYGWMLLEGVELTLIVSIASMAGATVAGLFASLGKLSSWRLLRLLMDAYTTIVRGVPELVLLLLVYYGLPTLIRDTAAAWGYAITPTVNPFAAGIGAITDRKSTRLNSSH